MIKRSENEILKSLKLSYFAKDETHSMKRQMWSIFLLMTSACAMHGQIVDDFNSPISQLSDLWQGDRDQFVINAQEELQLSDTTAGSSTLYQTTTWMEDMSWEIYIELDFSPSNSNRLELFLWADNEDLASSDAMLIRIGENGSEDALQLIQQSGSDRDVISTGSMGLVAEDPVVIRLKATIVDDMINISVDETGAVCFAPEIEADISPLDFGKEFFFGWQALYTSTRSDKFIWDDIYVGPERIDVTPPQLTSLSANDSSVELHFSEALDVSSIGNDQISLMPNVGFDIGLSKEMISLTFQQTLGNQTEYQLSLNDIMDLSGNSLDTTVTFRVPGQPVEQSLLINEILFNPEGSGSDYIEIFNNTTGLLDLSEVVLSNAQNGRSIELSGLPLLEPGAYLVLTPDVEDVINNYPNNDPSAIGEVAIPSLNNDDGNVTLTRGATIIDLYDYDEDHHQTFIDDVDGISLERISLVRETNNPSNWTSASEAVGFGTPGLANSALATSIVDETNVSLSSKVFSPNGDGDKDVVDVIYEVEGSGYLGSVTIYNDRGRLIRRLTTNEVIGQSGTITWDGTGDGGNISNIGIYVLHVSIFNAEGSRFEKKLSVGLGDFIN